MPPRIRVYVVADQSMYRAVLRRQLDQRRCTLVGHAGSLSDALPALGERSADVLLLDATLFHADLGDKVRLVRRLSPTTHVVVLAHHADPEQVEAALEAGAEGYACKDGCMEQLDLAIESAHRGVPFVSAEVCRQLHARRQLPPAI